MRRSGVRSLSVVVAAAVMAGWSVGSALAAPAWTVQSVPPPGGATNGFLLGVACKATGPVCFAVGTTIGSTVPLVEKWNGTSWTPQTVPAPGGNEPRTTSIACPSATVCHAVGWNDTGTRAFALKLTNGSWVKKPVPLLSGASYVRLQSVSCTAGNACTAVGFAVEASAAVPFAVRWNGTKWSVQAVPVPASGGGTLDDVHCASATSCLAVGNDGKGFAAKWNGTTWSLLSVAHKGTATNDRLNSISCTSATACTAVGRWQDGDGDSFLLAERWNGSAWTLQTPLTTRNSQIEFTGVSCTSATACNAVGYVISSSHVAHTIHHTWNGTTWSITPTPNMSAPNSAFNDVSCTAAAVCTGVGATSDDMQNGKPLAERYA